MTECEDVASYMSPPRFETFDAALAWVAREMPGEPKGGTVINNVAWALYQRQGKGA